MKSRISLFVLAACLVLSSVGCGFIKRRINPPSDAVKNYYKYMEAGNADEAVKLVSPGFVERTEGMDGFRQMVAESKEAITKGGGIESVEISRESISGEVAKVDYTLKLRNRPEGLKFNGELGWWQELGGWKIITLVRADR